MWFGVITIFPEMFEVLQTSITGRALKEKKITVATFNPRDFTENKHHQVDDRPYGGGPGMIMMVQPLAAAIQAAKIQAPFPPKVIYLSPQGRLFSQPQANIFLEQQALILLAGRYEGIDERIIETFVDEEWSIGDFILTGGELPAMVMIDVITRLIPGTLGDAQSVSEDSLSSGFLKYPQYTRPEQFQDLKVPEVLLSGNHQAIATWRQCKSMEKTVTRRPDLLLNHQKKPTPNADD